MLHQRQIKEINQVEFCSVRLLKLANENFSVLIPSCRITDIDPFVPVEFPGINYTVQGVAAIRGLQHEPRFTWQLTALLGEKDTNALRALFSLSDQRRRSYFHPGVTLDDTIHKMVEPTPRTRQIVPGYSEEIKGNGSYTEYFARYQVFIVDLKTPRNGMWYACSMSLFEVEKVLS